jgi:hypothetical protein
LARIIGIRVEPSAEASATAEPEMADGGVGEAHESVRDAALDHEFTGEDEERDGHQREGVHAGGHALEHDNGRQVEPEHGKQRTQAEREGDRHAEREQKGEAAEQDEQRHARAISGVRPARSFSACSRQNSTISAPATGKGR